VGPNDPIGGEATVGGTVDVLACSIKESEAYQDKD
jgi:hypothetical protein